jgi:hypothetical protein
MTEHVGVRRGNGSIDRSPELSEDRERVPFENDVDRSGTDGDTRRAWITVVRICPVREDSDQRDASRTTTVPAAGDRAGTARPIPTRPRG